MIKRLIHKRKRALLVAFAGVLLPGAVLAFFLIHSTSTATTPAGSVYTASDTVSMTFAGSPNSTTWTPGTAVLVDPVVHNTSATDTVLVNQVSLTGWSSTTPGCTSTAFPGMFTAPPATVNMQVAPGGTTGAVDMHVTMNDLGAGIDQSVCEGAPITLMFASN